MELKQLPLLPAPAPPAPGLDQPPVHTSSLINVDSVTHAFVCKGCQRIVHRIVADHRLPLGSTICFGTPSSLHSVEGRRDNPHPFDHLLDPTQNADDRSVAFTTVLCEACYTPARALYAENKIKQDQWQVSYAELLALCDRWKTVSVPALRKHLRRRVKEFEVSKLCEIIGEEAYAMLANRRLPYRQRRQQFEQVLDSKEATIEAYLTADLPIQMVWDPEAFDATVERSQRLAHDLGLTGPVGITRPLKAPKEGPYCTLRPHVSDITGAGGNALAWPALQAYEEFHPAAMLDEVRARIRLPATRDFVRQLYVKCRHLANTHFLLLKCELRWLNGQSG